MKTMRYHIGWLIVFLIGIADWLFKMTAISYFSDNPKQAEGLIALALHKNPGIAFDIPIPWMLLAPITIIIVCFCSYAFLRHVKTHNHIASLGYFAIIVGALNNFIDRAAHQFTTDYLIFFERSAINLSDVLIVAGALTLLWYHKSNEAR